jgi:hypothetical protein
MKCNSQSGNAFGSHWAQSLTLSPICESVFHFQIHSFGITCPCTPHLVANLMLRLQHYKIHQITNWATWKKHWNACNFSCTTWKLTLWMIKIKHHTLQQVCPFTCSLSCMHCILDGYPLNQWFVYNNMNLKVFYSRIGDANPN